MAAEESAPPGAALDDLLRDPVFRRGVCLDHVLPGREAAYASASGIPEALAAALRRRGVARLYTHQAEAFEAASAGRDLVVVTPTASGKTLCYNLPVLARILQKPDARALYLFPTKALAQDQLAELTELSRQLAPGDGPGPVRTFTYDGDTPPNARVAIREAGNVVVTNPDMLHAAILPHHTKWLKLFQNLEFVVIDELHAYRGVFGSHLGNVVRRLRRVCAFYGSNPTFVLASATIGNPGELAERILERPVRVIDRGGAPAAEKRLVFYNPPVVNPELGLRRSSLLESRRVALALLRGGAQTIVFGRSRLQVEVLLSYLREALPAQAVRGYRGGYLPLERREIERGLRAGEVRGVVATNALELGVDIGQMQAAVLCGYPGSIASTWQQLGRAGRRDEPSVGVLVCSSNPVDQFLARHPEFFLEATPEQGLVDPDNLLVLLGHLQASLFEVPLPDGEPFGEAGILELLRLLEEEGHAHHSAGRWFWTDEAFPAAEVSLRSVLAENVVIVDTSGGAAPRLPGEAAGAVGGTRGGGPPRVIGEMDQFAAQTLLHDQAIYLHEGAQYHVDRLDWAEKKAYVSPVAVDYWTDADRAARVSVLDTFARAAAGDGIGGAHGEVQVTSLATVFKKIRFHTHETIGQGPIDLPQVDLHTTSWWATVEPELEARFSRPELQAGLQGLAHALRHVASVFLMCDPRDLGTATHVRDPHTGLPTVFVYDVFPGGVGLSPRLFERGGEALRAAAELISACECLAGCPSCVGAMVEGGAGAKRVAAALGAAAGEPVPAG
jgi:DEAD/DEAH box helicase domain-containing protein